MNLMVGDAAAAIWVTQPPWLSPHRLTSSGVIAVRERRNSAAAIASRARSSSVSSARRPVDRPTPGRVVAQDGKAGSRQPVGVDSEQRGVDAAAIRTGEEDDRGVWAVPRRNGKDPEQAVGTA